MPGKNVYEFVHTAVGTFRMNDFQLIMSPFQIK